MQNPTNTIIASLVICVAIGYFATEKYGNFEIIMGVAVVAGMVIGTMVNFYLNRPKLPKTDPKQNTYPQDKF